MHTDITEMCVETHECIHITCMLFSYRVCVIQMLSASQVPGQFSHLLANVFTWKVLASSLAVSKTAREARSVRPNPTFGGVCGRPHNHAHVINYNERLQRILLASS